MSPRREKVRRKSFAGYTRLIDPLSPRLVALLRWLDDNGGHVQIRRIEMEQEVGMEGQALTRWIRWAELYGAIHVDRERRDFGKGAKPFTYHLLIPADEWVANARDIAKVVKAQLKGEIPRPKGKLPARGVSAIDPKELARIQEQARLEVLDAISAAEPLPPLVVDPLAYDDVEAWGSAFTA